VAFIRSTNPAYEGDVYVALSTGTGFGSAVRWSEIMCVANEECALGDINGDRSADVVAFVKSTLTGVREGDVWAALATRGPVAVQRTTAPTLDPVQVSGTTVTLRWTDRSSTEDTFEIFRRDPTSGSLSRIGAMASTSRAGTGQTYTFADTVVAGSRRCYEIAAHHYHRTGINYSNDVCTAPPGPVTPPAALPWGSITSLDTARTSGIFSSVAVGTDGLALISHYRGGGTDADRDLVVGHCVDVGCTAVTTTVIDSAGDVGWNSSIGIGGDGLGLISYRDNTNADLKVAHCDNVACTSATVTTLDTGQVTKGTALTIGGDGLGLIAYKDQAAGESVKVAHCLNAACTGARVSVVDTIQPTGGDAIDKASITTGSNGFGLISYVDGHPNTDLKVAACGNADCSAAVTSTVATDDGRYSSITVGRDGLGLVSYFGAGLKVAHCVNVYCTAVTATTLDMGDVGSDTSIAIGGDGLGIISYRDHGNKDLKVAHCADLACTTATTTVVDAFDDVGSHTSITKGPDGRPLVSYYDATNGDLRLARCPDVRCTGEFVTPF
jgi:hypothetical protein